MRDVQRPAILLGALAIPGLMAAGCYGGTGAMVLAAPTDPPECHAAAAAITHMLLAAYASGLQETATAHTPQTGEMPPAMLAEFDGRPQTSLGMVCKGLRANMKASKIALIDEVPARGKQSGKSGRLAVRATFPMLSPDRKGAMVRVGINCGGSCSGSSTYYLKFEDDRWRFGGMRTE